MTEISDAPAVDADGTNPAAALPGVTTTAAGKRLGELVDRVLAGERLALVRMDRRPAVLVSSAWYNRQPGASSNMVSTRTPEGAPISREEYVASVAERANSATTAPIQLDRVEAETVAELLDELAAAYTHADPVGRLARQCAVILYGRMGV